ncbi:helix-turn-helix domain-containing protein [Actinosynnema sp. NPDC059797]
MAARVDREVVMAEAGSRLGSTVRSRALGAELREARKRSGLKHSDLPDLLGITFAWLSKLELGFRRTSAHNIARLLGAYRVDSETYERVMGLYRDREDGVLICEHGPGEADGLPVLLGHEAAAREIFSYGVISIPVLAQAQGHMRALFGRDGRTSSVEVERLVTVRGGRQVILDRPTPSRYTFVVHEWTLRHLGGGPRVVWEQLMHLFWLANTGKVSVRVIGLNSKAGWWEGTAFTLMTSPGFRPVVHVETPAYSVFLDDPREANGYRESARLLLENAMSAEESRTLIGYLAGQVREPTEAGT